MEKQEEYPNFESSEEQETEESEGFDDAQEDDEDTYADAPEDSEEMVDDESTYEPDKNTEDTQDTEDTDDELETSSQFEEIEEPKADDEQEIDRSKDKKDKDILFPPRMNQELARKAGYYCTSYLGNDLYFMKEQVMQMIGYIEALKGEDYFEAHFPDWKKRLKNLQYLSSKLQEVKVWYDRLEDKKFVKKDADKEIRKFFLKSASKIPLMEMNLYRIYGFLMLNTNIKRQMIPSDAWRVLEQSGYRTLHLGKKKTDQHSTQPVESSGGTE